MIDSRVPIFSLQNLSVSFGPKPLLTDTELYIRRGDKICLIGRNGSGKSTLLKVIAGLIEPQEGKVFIQPAIRISYMPQESDLSGFKTFKDAILAGLPESEQADGTYKADTLMHQLSLNPTTDVSKASGGECKKAALARALIGEPDILLLDEPTNHLDIAAIEELEGVIARFKGAVLVISHDRAFLRRVSTHMLWLDRGKLRTSDRGFAYFDGWQEQILEQEIIEQKYLSKKIDMETEWLHRGVTARRKRNMGRLRRLEQLRAERREQISPTGSVALAIDKGSIASRLIVEAKHISKSFGDRPIVSDFSIRILRGNKIGVVGPNGAGKTTLIKLLTGRLAPDGGHIRLAKNLQEAYFDQNRITLNPKKTLWKTLCPEGDHIFVRGVYRHVVAYLKDFLFTPEQAQSPVGVLSGGEKNRLMLALSLATPSNFLVLDEPTNDLDMDTLDLLQDALENYEGTILIVSHDRDFLDKTATFLLAMDGTGLIQEYVGPYSEWIEKNHNQPGTVSPVKRPLSKSTPAPTERIKPDTPPKKKLTFSQQHRLNTLPTEIDALTLKIKRIETDLHNPDLYQQDPDRFDACIRDLAAYKQQANSLENEWLTLQLLADEDA